MHIRTTVRAVIAAGLVGIIAGCAPVGPEAGGAAPDAQKSKKARPGAGAEKVRYASAERLPERIASDGTTIEVGNPAARSTVHAYEDPRCPAVEMYERTGAGAVHKLVLGGEIKTEYTFASFKDDRLGGNGSKRAVNALRAALEKGKFVEYHAVIFKNQAAVESSGGFTVQRLLKLADKVPGLRGEAFDRAVRTMKYRSFVTASQQAYQQTGDDPIGPGTPTVVVNGHTINNGLWHVNFDPSLLRSLVTELHDSPGLWDLVYKPYRDEVQDESLEP
ncbi:thioredoxin domain-containing protein [Streptomyces sp. BG9H]|uniref:Thioredoxin domain-containing protein n=1 Tax=Streptomyces anatolicus TaxID=2675858 RepID=A0ABS6YG91_9ACTN|nr:thioredoxin domain-containing protein [Streptomyces anatolicus]MBW5420099.1 thioredoxin domain-containing protein [Streptomyces anatolicus]